MSGLETDVIPILGPMMTGATVTLGLAEQALLARWAEKTAFVWEFVDEKHPVSSKPQRRAFKAAGEESSVSQVWIGHYIGPDDRPTPLASDLHGYTPPAPLQISRETAIREGLLNHRFTAIAVGGALFYVAFATSPDLLASMPFPLSGHLWERLVRLQPAEQNDIVWPPTKGLDYLDFMDLVGRRAITR